MRRILKNMIPYWKTVIVIVLLLCVQAYCDLALPTYTSRIIDVGIQDRGIEHIAPEAITEESFRNAQAFMDDSERKLWESIYDKEGKIYRLKIDDEEKLSQIDEQLLMPIVAAYQIGKALENGDISQAELEQASADMMTMEEMEKAAESIGDETLMSMGVAFAAECNEAAGLDVDKMQTAYLWSAGGKMLGIAFIMLAASVMVAFFAARVGAGIGRNLRNKVFRNVVSFSNGEMDKFSTASLITRNTNDVQQIQMVSAMLLRMILYAPIIAIGGIYNVWKTGANMGWVIGLAVVVIMGFVFLLVSIAMPKFKIMQTLVDGLNLVSREILTGLPVIRAFGREEAEEERFDEANRKLMKTQLNLQLYYSPNLFGFSP